MRSRWWSLLVGLAPIVSLGGCTSGPATTDVEYVLEVRIAGGAITEVTPILTGRPGEHRFAQPRGTGNLRVDLSGPDGEAWSGQWSAPPFIVVEDFEGSRIHGDIVERPERTIYVAVPAAPDATELDVRLTLERPDGTPQVVNRTLEVQRPAPVAGPILAGDVGGSRQALSLCLNDSHCAEDEFCAGVACREDVCYPEPGSPWDATVTEIAGGGGIRVVFLPLGPTGSPEALEADVTRMVEQMNAEVDWFADNADAFSYAVFRGDCFDSSPGDFGEGLGMIEGLPSDTRLLPSFDILIGVHPGDIRAAANGAPGTAIVLATSDSGYVLAHELGHAFGGLGDEYFEVQGPQALFDFYCGASSFLGINQYPNVSSDDTPPWVCDFGGQACPAGGVVGAYRGASCNWYAPCPTSIMKWHEGAQFDPVGVAAMDHMLANGTVLRHGDCECDSSCEDIPDGTCGLSGCFTLCDRCGGTQICTNELDCRLDCGGGPECLDVFDAAHCPGTEYIVDVSGSDGSVVMATCGGTTAPADCERIDGVDDCSDAPGCGYMHCASRCVPEGTFVSQACGCESSFWEADCNGNPACVWDATAAAPCHAR
ncbi:MAG: hypothetical protein IT378_16465 [Sandaracinaceae bacterium]|nr:hypothetical protein [Sandaracinaceae bacterium]